MLEKLPDVIGHVLHQQRAGLDKLAIHKVDLRQGMGSMQVMSLAFLDHAPLPALYTADGRGTSPPLQWTGVPAEARSVALIVEDADSPTPQPLVHAIVVDLPGEDGSLREGALDENDEGESEVRSGRHSFLQTGWLPPDPPPGHGVHRYAFQVFALADGPAFSETPGREELLDAIRERALASGWVIGTYERPDGSEKIGTQAPVAVRAGDPAF
ncbi:MAG: YbhB/YbcL family Raf kinase inhibitor-like protein [Rubrivivax sp.]|nr:MAG: YbhB/YbcL family Raf kinase inhibitor-like protein [Rubrivivax sp.]